MTWKRERSLPMLSRLSEISDILACPRCRGPLSQGSDDWRCSEVSCRYASEPFPVVDGRPVLVDFDSNTILERDRLLSGGAATLVRRRSGLVARWLRRVSSPTSRITRRNVAHILAMLRERSWHRVLIVGGATIGSELEPLYGSADLQIIAFDVYASDLVQFIADGHSIPLSDRSIDAVIVQAVLEHVVDPPRVVAEIHRVLRDDGLVYAETPFLQQVHEASYDFSRFTHSGHRFLFRAFDEISSGAVMGAGTQLRWSLEHFIRSMLRSVTAGQFARLALFWLSYLDRVVPDPFTLDTASAVYFLGRKSAGILQPRELVGYYRGAQR